MRRGASKQSRLTVTVSHSGTVCTAGSASTVFFVFLQRLLRHHGEMGDPGEAERPLGESGTKHVHTFALRRHNERLREGEMAQSDRPLGSSSKISLRNFTQVFFVCLLVFVCFFENLQKHVTTSDKWLDRLVSG